jgi:hypothetical protein
VLLYSSLSTQANGREDIRYTRQEKKCYTYHQDIVLLTSTWTGKKNNDKTTWYKKLLQYINLRHFKFDESPWYRQLLHKIAVCINQLYKKEKVYFRRSVSYPIFGCHVSVLPSMYCEQLLRCVTIKEREKNAKKDFLYIKISSHLHVHVTSYCFSCSILSTKRE